MVTAVALAPALAVAVSSVVTLWRDQTLALRQEALRTAELVTLELQQTVTGVESVLRTLAAAPVTKRGDLKDCSALMAEAALAVDYLSDLMIVDEDGRVRCT